MKKHSLAFIDIETTGLNLIESEIIEIGCIVTNASLNIVDEFELKIKPEHIETADPISIKINHYDSENWGEAIALNEAIKILADKTENTTMVGHNISFDAAFLDKAFFETGIKKKFFHYHLLDTVSIAFAKLSGNQDIEKFTLHGLCEYFEIKNEHEHRALSDARATLELYKKLMSL
jgi:DNA polymerase III epsilon subunit family exonuclease